MNCFLQKSWLSREGGRKERVVGQKWIGLSGGLPIEGRPSMSKRGGHRVDCTKLELHNKYVLDYGVDKKRRA